MDKPLYVILRRTPTSIHLEGIAPLREAQCIGLLLKAANPEATYIAPPLMGRCLAKFGSKILRQFYWDLSGKEAPETYPELLRALLDELSVRDVDNRSLRSLEAAVETAGVSPLDFEPKRAEPSQLATPKEKKPKEAKGLGHTKLVWLIADELKQKNGGAMPHRKVIIDACLAEGIKQGTAGVQYAAWKKAQGGS